MNDRSPVPTEFQATEPMITERQHDFLRSLATERDIPVEARDQIIARLDDKSNHEFGQVTKKLASTWIGRLVDKPKLPPANAPAGVAQDERRPLAQLDEPWEVKSVLVGGDREAFCMSLKGTALQVPRGSYALSKEDCPDIEHFLNDINFFSVWIHPEGERWSVKLYKSEERIKIARRTQYAVLKAIARDPLKAASLYGHETKRCGICGIKLTKDESRARGIGPICAENWGW